MITYLNYVLYLLYLFTYLLSYLFRKMKEIFIVSTHVSPIFDPYVYKVVKFFIRPNNNLTEISWEKSTLRLNIEEVREAQIK